MRRLPKTAAAKRRALPAALSRAISAALALLAGLVLFPVRWHPAGTGIDTSWATALNQFATRGTVFGRDVAFNYGPLGYLVLPMPFGSNLECGIAFQCAGLAAIIGLLVWLGVTRRIALWNMALFLVCMVAGARAVREFGFAGPDMAMEAAVLWFAGASLVGAWWPAAMAAVLAAVLAFVKWSSGVAAVSAVVLFAGAAIVARRWQFAVTLVAAVAVVFTVLGFVLCGDAASLARYVRASFEISSGYSSAMTLAGPGTPFVYAALILLGCVALAVILYAVRDRAWAVAAAGLAPLFIEFKHSFVRQDSGHVQIFFAFLPLYMAAVLLFLQPGWTPRRLTRFAGPLVLIVGPWWAMERHVAWAPFANVANAPDLLHVRQLKSRLSAISAERLAADRLDPELLAAIRRRSVTVYPFENSYAAANPIDYQPLPIFQSYVASTAYLDEWNARFLDAASRPDLVLLELTSIDGRHALLDCPQTLLAMYRNYEWDRASGDRMLLRRRPAPLGSRIVPLRAYDARPGEIIRIPLTTHPVVVRIGWTYGTTGHLERLFTRIGEVDAVLWGGRRAISVRVPPEVLPGGVPLNMLPSGPPAVRELFESNAVRDPFEFMTLGGAGLSAAAASFRVEILELPDISLAISSDESNPLAARDAGVWDRAAIESVNPAPAHAAFRVQGWAIPPWPGAKLYVCAGSDCYAAEFGAVRRDIGALYGGTEEALHSGFEAVVPWAAQRELRLVMLSPDRTQRYDGRNAAYRMGE